MKLTRRQMTCMATFTLALVALVVDRLWVVPRGATAALGSDPEKDASSLVVGTSSMPDVPTAPKTLAERLDLLCAQYDFPNTLVRDAFRAPAGWGEPVSPASTSTSYTSALPEGVTPFGQRHRLTAIVIHNRTRCAFIDGSLLACGQILDGYELIAVDEESATFQGGGEQVVLTLPNAP